MKNKYDDALQEAFLKSAFKEAALQDIAELEAMDIEIKYPTEKQKREIEREIRKVQRRSSRGFGRLGRAVAMIAIVLCITFGVIMVQPTVRASVWDVVVSFFEKYLSFDFDANAPEYAYNLGEYTITYIPKGFALEETQSAEFNSYIVFNGNERSALVISLYYTPISQANIDVENSVSKTVKIGENTGYMLNYKDNATKQLVWGDETHTFMIRGDISEGELFKISKNIQ